VLEDLKSYLRCESGEEVWWSIGNFAAGKRVGCQRSSVLRRMVIRRIVALGWKIALGLAVAS
jgi:hypothetical protein